MILHYFASGPMDINQYQYQGHVKQEEDLSWYINNSSISPAKIQVIQHNGMCRFHHITTKQDHRTRSTILTTWGKCSTTLPGFGNLHGSHHK